jgi:hypothetical protein
VVAAEKQIETQEDECDKRHSHGLMYETEPSHKKRDPYMALNERAMEVVSGEREQADGNYQAPVHQT